MFQVSAKIAGALAGALLSLSPALAADPAPIAAAVRAPVVVPPPTWSGCYVGGHVGWGFGSKDIANPVFPIFAPLGETFQLPVNGVFAGGQVGCDRQTPNNFVFGLEVSGSWANITGTKTDTFTISSGTRDGTASATAQWLASATVRAGRAFDHLLVYGKGGVAFDGDKYRYTGLFTCSGICIGNPAFDFNADEVRVGWTLGVGVAWARPATPWSVRLEYDYYDFGSRRVTFYDANGGFPAGVGVPVDIAQRIHTVRLGIDRKF